MNAAAIRMTDDAALKLYRIAEEFFSRPENRELSKRLAEEDATRKMKNAS